MRENKTEFCNQLCELLRMTGNLGNPANNALKELRYIRLDNGDEIVRPVFEDGGGENGYYDVNVSGDNCMGILCDVYNKFIKHY